MTGKKFDYNLADSQGTALAPIDPAAFRLEEYAEYEAALLEQNRRFWESDSGVAVYRRFRAPQAFAGGCRDMQNSLGLQLAALQESMRYKADIANFLEPWYGIGTVASSFGLDYIWHENLAPALQAPFASIDEALRYPFKMVEDTPIGRYTLAMMEYFLEQTQGKIPISLTDCQAPLNIAANLVNISSLFVDLYDNPAVYQQLVEVISDLMIDFTKKQLQLLGGALANPGHGFASSRRFKGIGLSDDNMLMISDKMYERFELPAREKIGAAFGGTAFHSCGNWALKIPVVQKIGNLVCIDGAFSAETDPSPNPLEPFAEAFAGSGVVVNARMVGDAETVIGNVRKIWRPGMKLIVVTYCQTPAEQEMVYDRIHEICN